MSATNGYQSAIREIDGKVTMQFYENSSDNDADLSLVETGKTPVTDTGTEWRSYALKQTVSAGLHPEKKYATLDGLSKLEDTVYPYPETPETIMALWSRELSGTTAVAGNPGYAFANPPVLRQEYHALRKIGFFRLVGEEQWAQGPTAYKIRLYVPAEEFSAESEPVETIPPADYKAFLAQTPAVEEKIISGKSYKIVSVSISATEENCVKQYIGFDRYYQATKAELEITSWSAPGTPAKIMFFSNSLTAEFFSDNLSMIKVLEEKTDSVEELSYGISSNYCEVKVFNENDRFSRNPDLLKKNRIVKPFIRGGQGGAWDSLGTFYSDSWEVSAGTSVVSCKAYDVLYNLQKLYVTFPLKQSANGTYAVSQNVTIREAFEELGALINASKNAAGIYGDDLTFVFDSRLAIDPSNIATADKGYDKKVFPYVLLGHDTAWNLLSTLANAARCHVYVNRSGQICVVWDEPDGETQYCDFKIDESNAFSYNLPTMSRTIANRIVVPYCYLGEAGKIEDSRFTFEKKDFEYENNNIVVKIELKNFYDSITGIDRKEDDFFEKTIISNIKEIRYSFNQIEVVFNEGETAETIYLKVNGTNPRVLKEANYTYENHASQKRNGIVEFTLKSGKMIFEKDSAASRDCAKKVAERIGAIYGDGKSYIETSWTGDSQLDLGRAVQSRGSAGDDYADYEVVSNEIMLRQGLRFTTKARKIP